MSAMHYLQESPLAHRWIAIAAHSPGGDIADDRQMNNEENVATATAHNVTATATAAPA